MAPTNTHVAKAVVPAAVAYAVLVLVSLALGVWVVAYCA